MTSSGNLQIDEILSYIKEQHNKHADGCKGSCFEQVVGYRNPLYEESHWYCTFGGYCFGNLNRHEEVVANTLEELAALVVAKIHNAIVDCEAEDME